ncbi:MAG: hypothetical protein DBX47_02305 [Clostridiales bacterium]|nr:MAG: hypothetical protein DBX47_02305 [Clostridiales bacterium]
MNDPREQLNRFNELIKEMDSLYGEFAKAGGISDAAFWILYTLRDEGPCTQTKIYERWAMGKQTVNNEVKKLETTGMITLSTSTDDKRSKILTLTKKGVEYAKNNIDIIFKIEQHIFEQLSSETRAALLSSCREYVKILREETETFIKSK